MYKSYDYVIIGAGIAGCSIAHFLRKKTNQKILVIDKNDGICKGASGAAGAFLSPLLGKENNFKNLVSNSLKFSTNYYKNNLANDFYNFGVCRIAKNNSDQEKFKSYKNHMDFKFKELDEGYFFEIGSYVNPKGICESLLNNVDLLLNYEVNEITNNVINKEIEAKKLFLTTGADISLINEEYFNIRAVWGQKISIKTNTKLKHSYHKACSLSKDIDGIVTIGATHHRFDEDMKDSSYSLNNKNINDLAHNDKTLDIMHKDTNELISLANDIKKLENIEVIDVKIGARASSLDYFPMLGKLVDSKKSIKSFPHILNGSFIKDENLIMYDSLYVLNGVGGRGFVLSLYLANMLVDSIFNDVELPKDITTHRMFKRWAKRLKNKR